MGRAARVSVTGLLALAAALVIGAAPALACGGLVGPGGTVQLSRTTTLAAYHDGVEHYVTAFEYRGGGARFGSIIPLPGVPTKVEKGGDWTLQRLIRETQPLFKADAVSAPAAEARWWGAARAEPRGVDRPAGRPAQRPGHDLATGIGHVAVLSEG